MGLRPLVVPYVLQNVCNHLRAIGGFTAMHGTETERMLAVQQVASEHVETLLVGSKPLELCISEKYVVLIGFC